jgi:hypothetical protein
MQISMVESALDQLLAARTAEEFHAGFGAAMGMAMGAMMTQATSGGLGQGGQTPAGSASGNAGAPTFSPPASAGAETSGFDRQASESPINRNPVAPGGEISLSEADRFIGRKVRVTRRNGSNASGRLSGITDDSLVLQKQIGAGSMSFEVSKQEILTLALADR